MDAERFRRLERLFAAAVELEHSERRAFLDRECADDPSLAAECLELLAQPSALSASRLGHAVATLEAFRSADDGRTLPQFIAGYRVLARLGVGGMGVVYAAEQAQPRRRVAVKVLRPGSESEALLRRLEREANALARLEHPGIARVIESGRVRENGEERGYLVMEYVEGLTLQEHVTKVGASVRERVALMVRICNAVQHAHERGVIHRDLKPQNVLVTPAGAPVVLDFGVARIQDSSLTTLETRSGQVVGTLAYMSPEQASGSAHAIDVRTDVYSLGVMLYELLANRLPIDLRGRTTPAALRAITEEEPAPLSARDASLRGDLTTILAKALEKRRERRYASALALEQELEHYLADEPILARPPSTIYRLRKFARRHPSLAAACAIAALGLLGGGAVAWSGYRRAVDAAELARARQTEVERELTRRERAFEFVNSIATLASQSFDPNVPFRDLLDRARSRLESDFSDDLLLRAELADALGASYHTLGLTEQASALLESSWRDTAAVHGPHDARSRAALKRYAIGADRVGELYGIERLREDAEEARLRGDVKGQLWNAHQVLVCLLHEGCWNDVLSASEAQVRELVRQPGQEFMHGLFARERAYALSQLGRKWEALEQFRESESLLRASGAASAADDLQQPIGGQLIALGRNAEAVVALELAYAAALRDFGPLSERVNYIAINLARAHQGLRPERTREVCESILSNAAQIGLHSDICVSAAQTLCQVLVLVFDEPQQAADVLRAVEAAVLAKPQPPAEQLAALRTHAALAAAELGDLEGARELRRSAQETLVHVFGPGHTSVQMNFARLAIVCARLGASEDLEGQREDLEAMRADTRITPQRVWLDAALGSVLHALGERERSTELLRAAVPALRGSTQRAAPRELLYLESLLGDSAR